MQATTRNVRAALLKKYGKDDAGDACISFYRHQAGYYYFSGIDGTFIPSLYQFTLENTTVEEIMQHVARYI